MAAVEAYVSAFLAGEPKHYLGHNPIGRIAVLVILVLLVVQAVTGLVLAGTDIFYPPLRELDRALGRCAKRRSSHAYAADAGPHGQERLCGACASFRSPFAEIHEIVFYLLLAMIALHVVAVVATELREGGALVSAMLTGRKIIRGRPEDL